MLMSTLNLGGIVSSQLGALLTYYLGITEENFDKLWLLILISNLSSLIPLVWVNMIDQKGKKLTDSDLSSSSKSEPVSESDSPCDKEEVKIETSTLTENNSNTL